MRNQMTITQKSYQAYPKLVTVVGAKSGEKVNYMAAAWHTYLSHTPPLYGVAIAPKRFTHDMIIESGEFNCNFLPFNKLKLINSTGRISGKDCDKIEILNLQIEQGISINTPFISDAYAVIECKLKQRLNLGDHTLFIGEIVHTKEKGNAFRENGILDCQNISPTFYLGSDTYITTDKSSINILPHD
ncbi:MAG: flavin reductase [Candidatus Neomarinimicrobiota bacterium]|nr:MAG: flavin reductase [Candidatus Neomarinimicrobiota bacterium]